MRQWIVDAFASAPFMGNPAGVVEPFGQWPDDAWMQTLAIENNQAETAFLLKTDRPDRYGLRWFTPGMEVPLCGHATLASAHVLMAELKLTEGPVTFDTLSGPLIVRRAAEGYEMDFPADPPRRTAIPDGLSEAMGVTPVEVWAGAYLVAVLENEAQVRALKPDIAAVNRISGEATGGRGNLIVAAFADPGSPVDVVDRFFAPGSGVAEDPATGSAHCILAPLYADKLGRDRVTFFQAYPGRGGDLECEMKGERVLLRGQAFTTVEGRLRA
ncbi:MAG: PhzF family phenazine biosynthesis protein [Caulobacteraceae bacterium]|nr:PhzF family phenazine biosynthesis protein [Caulobacteraceae bacterium]